MKAKQPKYNSIEDIKYDLKVYQLERKIALEQIKSLKNELKEDTDATKLLPLLLARRLPIILGAFKILKKVF